LFFLGDGGDFGYSVADRKTTLHRADVVVLMEFRSVDQQVWEVLKPYNLLKQTYIYNGTGDATQSSDL
jgi:hypothetical protein